MNQAMEQFFTFMDRLGALAARYGVGITSFCLGAGFLLFYIFPSEDVELGTKALIATVLTLVGCAAQLWIYERQPRDRGPSPDRVTPLMTELLENQRFLMRMFIEQQARVHLHRPGPCDLGARPDRS